MMENFSHILQHPSIKKGMYSPSDHFGRTSHFKVQVNFDILIFEGQIHANALKKWLNLLECYFSIHNFYDMKKITFKLLKDLPHVKHWWETYWEKSSIKDFEIHATEPTWDLFVDAVNEQYYPIGNYVDHHMKWTTLRQYRGTEMSEFKNNLHTLHTKLSIKYSERHLVLNYRGALHKYIETEMDFMDVSSLGDVYRYVVKIEQKFENQNKRKFYFSNTQQPNYGKDNLNNQPSKNKTKPQEKKSNRKTKKDTGKWFDLHKIPWHNTNECHSK
jgi:hypothetical protein